MSVLAVIAALAIEQWRPLGDRKAVSGALLAWATWLERSFNGGEFPHGLVAWLVAGVPALAASGALHHAPFPGRPLLALAVNIALLYLPIRFCQVSHYFTDL